MVRWPKPVTDTAAAQSVNSTNAIRWTSPPTQGQCIQTSTRPGDGKPLASDRRRAIGSPSAWRGIGKISASAGAEIRGPRPRDARPSGARGASGASNALHDGQRQ